MRGGRFVAFALAWFMGAKASFVFAQVDTLAIVVNSTKTVGNVPSPSAMGSFGYDPVNDRMFVAGFSGLNQQLRLIEDVNGTQTVHTQVFTTSWLRFTKNNNLDYGGGVPSPAGILLNPKAIGSLPAYSMAVIDDGNSVLTSPGMTYPDLTQRIYRYDLQEDTDFDSRNNFTSLLTLGQMKSLSGVTTNVSNQGRQFAWSGDGKSIYMVDQGGVSGALFAGIYKVPVDGSAAPSRIYAPPFNPLPEMATEPAVLTKNGIDKIFIRGGGTTGNSGGIDFVTYDGTSASASSRQIAVPAATLNDFWEVPANQVCTIFSMCTDDAGNIYFSNTNGNAGQVTIRGLFRLDPQGHLSKVASYNERVAVFGGTPGVNMLREQTRTVKFTSGSKTFDVTQIMYNESGTIVGDTIAGAYAFKPGDFNRDNDVNSIDANLFKTKLTVKGVNAATNDLRYDMNGNGQITWKDLKIFQQFYVFPNGDSDLNLKLNWADYVTLKSNFNTSSKTWLAGDFTGDGLVNILDFNILAGNFGITAAGPQPSEIDWNQLSQAIPEPTGLVLGLLPSLFLLYRPLSRSNRKRV